MVIANKTVLITGANRGIGRALVDEKATPESAARGIFDGPAQGVDEIFPDPASQSVAEGWRVSMGKALECQFAAFVPLSMANAA
jgi:NAD(P)-dependent dehydrogenase (short-subunit alcohol dehydrogenase family)